MSEIPTYCLFIQLASFENVLQVLGDGAPALAEKYADQLLRQPNGFLRYADLDTVLARLSREDEELSRAVADLEFLLGSHGAVLQTNRENVCGSDFLVPPSVAQRPALKKRSQPEK